MKRILILFMTLLLTLTLALPAYAIPGKVSYVGGAEEFIFQPGTAYSLTDLFPNFKEVIPGNTLTQKITVKNDAANKVKVRIYMRSLGARPGSEAFLSKLWLQVAKSADNEMPYMFDAPADETAQLTEWTYLGTLYSGGTVDLDVTLQVPTSLDNRFQDAIGYLEWEFKVEELPVGPGDPVPPTGDHTDLLPWFVTMGCALAVMLALVVRRKKNQETSVPAEKR